MGLASPCACCAVFFALASRIFCSILTAVNLMTAELRGILHPGG